MVLGVAAADQPEAHVHVFKNLVDHGFVGDANDSAVVPLDRRGGLRPAHLHKNVSKGYHGFGADEEA